MEGSIGYCMHLAGCEAQRSTHLRLLSGGTPGITRRSHGPSAVGHTDVAVMGNEGFPGRHGQPPLSHAGTTVSRLALQVTWTGIAGRRTQFSCMSAFSLQSPEKWGLPPGYHALCNMEDRSRTGSPLSSPNSSRSKNASGCAMRSAMSEDDVWLTLAFTFVGATLRAVLALGRSAWNSCSSWRSKARLW